MHVKHCNTGGDVKHELERSVPTEEAFAVLLLQYVIKTLTGAVLHHDGDEVAKGNADKVDRVRRLKRTGTE